jgi:hypothetical protein
MVGALRSSIQAYSSQFRHTSETAINNAPAPIVMSPISTSEPLMASHGKIVVSCLGLVGGIGMQVPPIRISTRPAYRHASLTHNRRAAVASFIMSTPRVIQASAIRPVLSLMQSGRKQLFGNVALHYVAVREMATILSDGSC